MLLNTGKQKKKQGQAMPHASMQMRVLVVATLLHRSFLIKSFARSNLKNCLKVMSFSTAIRQLFPNKDF